jgi:hypothetical protein
MADEILAPEVEEVGRLEDPFAYKDLRTPEEIEIDVQAMIVKALRYLVPVYHPSLFMHAPLAGAPHGGQDGEQGIGETPPTEAAG